MYKRTPIRLLAYFSTKFCRPERLAQYHNIFKRLKEKPCQPRNTLPDTNNSQFVWKPKDPDSQSNLKKEEWNWRINLPDSRLYYKATVIRIVWYWHKDKYRSMEQNRKFRDKSTHLWTAYLRQRR